MMAVHAFFDPVALGFVIGASVAVAWIQNGGSAMAHAFAALRKDIWQRPNADAEAGHRAVLRIEHMVESRGINCADRIKSGGAFVAEAAEALANQRSLDGFQEAVRRLAEERRSQWAAMVRCWENIADAAPAMGMLGTVVGLIMLFGKVDNAAAIGQAMAIALLTTLYGLILANLVAGPIAQRLARIGNDQLAWQDDAARRLVALGRREYPDIARLSAHAHAHAHDDDAADPAAVDTAAPKGAMGAA